MAAQLIELDETYAVKVDVLEWKGQRRLDVRLYTHYQGWWRASKIALMIPMEKAAEFAAAVNQAIADGPAGPSPEEGT